jgi:hypothetical protein
MTLVEHATQQRRRALVDVAIDDEKGRAGVFTLQHVQQLGRCGWVRPIVKRQINRRGTRSRHVPDRSIGIDPFEQERKWRRVRQHDDAGRDRDQDRNMQQRLSGQTWQSSDSAPASEKEPDDEDDQNQPAKAASYRWSAVVVPASAAEQQEQDEDDENGIHADFLS